MDARSISLNAMAHDIGQYLSAVPFEQFSIVTSSGRRYPIPSSDHAGIIPTRNRVVIWFDDGGSVTISALHIAAIEKKSV